MIIKEPISQTIWDLKYRYRYRGKIIDQKIDDTWRRVAKAVAKAEKLPEQRLWERRFYEILQNFRFLPGGRILAGAGTSHSVTLCNCFVMDIAEDSIPGIFSALAEGALTLQQGGGVGYDFSVLRPAGDLVKKKGLTASGPVSFMRIWDTTCNVLLSTGARRGAMMGVLRCDHPDIEAFIAAKAERNELRHFNVSVLVSDEFMQAVQKNANWALVFPTDEPEAKDTILCEWGGEANVPCRLYKTIPARELWERIIRSAYDYAEPGVLFIDTINRFNNLWYREYIHATNPCGEIPLPAYGACNLGSINLTQFVEAPFTEKAKLNWVSIEETVRIATRFQDNVIDISHYPLKAQLRQSQGTRRIGLGITGLADALVMLGICYGSTQSIALAKELMGCIAKATWETSIELAKEKGAFPFYKSDYVQSQFVQTLAPEIQRAIAANGIRNSHHNTIAPAGTISLLANNVTNGIEPIFRPQYLRHVRNENNELLSFNVQNYALGIWREFQKDEAMPPAWIDTETLLPQAHLAIQAAMQPYIDNAISKTINLPGDFPFSQLSEVYTEAYHLGLKGCTVFRPNPITGSILEESHEPASVDHCCQYEE